MLISENDLSDEFLNIFKLFSNQETKSIEYRVYFDENGKIITYTVEDLPGNYILVSKEEYSQRRMDAIVKNNKLIFTNYRTHVLKLEKSSVGVKSSKYDVTIISDDREQVQSWEQVVYEIRRYN